MEKPIIAGKTPIGVELEAGKTYAWCSCGKSTNQPFCDGSHKGSELILNLVLISNFYWIVSNLLSR